MKAKTIMQSIILQSLLVVILTVTAVPMAVSEMICNDNVNIEGELFLNGESCGITYSNGSRQTTASNPTWDQILPDEERFEQVMPRGRDSKAVLDRETGLVWQRNAGDSPYNWYNAQYYCYTTNIGGRGGWRLPSVEELRSLIDPTQLNPALPTGHPFISDDNLSSYYWSSTTSAGNTSSAWTVNFSNGSASNGYGKTGSCYVRAVRSGQ